MYPATVRRQIAQRLRSGEPVVAVAAETGVPQSTLFRWKRQALIDAGVIDGIASVEADELSAARKRIAQLEAELALTRDACALFNAEAVVPPKRRRAIAEGLIARGHSARSACRITGLARSNLQYHRRRPVPDRQIRRLIVADAITEIHQRSRCTYGGRRIRAALLDEYEMNVNLKLVRAIMIEHGISGLPHPPQAVCRTLGNFGRRQSVRSNLNCCVQTVRCLATGIRPVEEKDGIIDVAALVPMGFPKHCIVKAQSVQRLYRCETYCQQKWHQHDEGRSCRDRAVGRSALPEGRRRHADHEAVVSSNNFARWCRVTRQSRSLPYGASCAVQGHVFRPRPMRRAPSALV
jgi:transposase-like protein